MKETFLGAQLSDEFFKAIANRSTKNMLRLALLKAYFPDYTIGDNGIELRYTKEIENQILYNKLESHEPIVIPQITDEAIETLEEQLILRKYIFRKAVLETYNYQCAVSGLKIESAERE